MNKSHLTAITRKGPSRPVKYLEAMELLDINHLDYGCGRGADADHLNCDRYDPHYSPDLPKGVYDTITCSFVLNVIECKQEREDVLNKIRDLLTRKGKAYVTVRRDIKKEGFTSKGTYQETIHLDLPIVFSCSDFIIYEVSK